MRLRLLSDIHLELSKTPDRYMKQFIPSNISDDILILAGDIGNPTSKIYKIFLTEISKYYAKVFIIAGNHEYYQRYQRYNSVTHTLNSRYDTTFRHSIEDIDKIARSLTNELPNVHFLQRDVLIYQRVRFLGCTLWSTADPSLTKYMNDYEMIKDMTAEKSNDLNSQDVKWLEEQLKLNDETYDTTVVITHHLPSYKLISEKYTNHPLNGFFANHLDELVEKADIWVCGHSHSAKTIEIGKCKCYINPVGYSGERTDYNMNCLIEIPDKISTVQSSL